MTSTKETVMLFLIGNALNVKKALILKKILIMFLELKLFLDMIPILLYNE